VRLIGVDVGGTFTDVVYADTERNQCLIHKVATTPADPSIGVMTGIGELCDRDDLARGTIDYVLHGTTIATNAVLEHKGARTGVVTTEGYRDILHIGRHQRPHHYSIQQEIPWQDRALAKRRHRKVVRERLVPPKGEVLVPLDEDGVRRAARSLKEDGVDSVAVCFLFSYLNPEHEERAREILEEELPGTFVTTSSSVSPQFREFERFTTAAMNAFVGPTVRNYVSRLERSFEKQGLSRAELRIMRSNGGVATSETVAEKPVLTLLSGPAAGVLGGAWIGRLSGRDHLITFDVGGTSADIGVLTGGEISEASARDTWIGGYPVMVPMIDIHTIGAGGGSLAYLDPGGTFRVGPQSAGADPGPAAYGRGGARPTATDANVVLGRLDADHFLGGELSLDVAAARAAVDELATPLGLSTEETAEGILTILNHNMANAIRSRTVQKGIDPRGYTLVAFGGAGPLHGAEVAATLGIPEVIIPPYPGIHSALGLLVTDLKYDAIRTELQQSGRVDYERLNRDFTDMERGLGPGKRFERTADLRYAGQGYELRVPVLEGRVDEARLASAFDAFHRRHEREYGHFFPDSPIEIVNIRVSATGETPKIVGAGIPSGGSLGKARIATTETIFRLDGELREIQTHFYQRHLLPLEEVIPGPAVFVQKDTTTVVPPGTSAWAEPTGNLVLRIGGRT